MAAARKRKKRPAQVSICAQVMNTVMEICRTGRSDAGGDISWIDIRGQLDSPVRGVTRMLLSVQVEESPELRRDSSVGIGSFAGFKPLLKATIWLEPNQFAQLWTLAAAGRIRRVELDFDAPYRNSSTIRTVAFATELAGGE